MPKAPPKKKTKHYDRADALPPIAGSLDAALKAAMETPLPPEMRRARPAAPKKPSREEE